MSPYRSDLAAMVRRRAALVRELRDLDVALNERTAAATPRPSHWAAWRLRRALKVLERYGPGVTWTWLLRRLLGPSTLGLGEVEGPTSPRPPAPTPEPPSVQVRYEHVDGEIIGVDIGQTSDHAVVAVVDRDRGFIEFEEVGRENSRENQTVLEDLYADLEDELPDGVIGGRR